MMSSNPKRSAGRPASGSTASSEPISLLPSTRSLGPRTCLGAAPLGQLPVTLACEQRGADRTEVHAEPSVRHVERDLQGSLEHPSHEGDDRQAPGEYVRRLWLHALHQLPGAAGERDDRPGANVLGAPPGGQVVDHFGLGEDGAHARDLGRIRGLVGEPRDVARFVAQIPGSLLEERAAPRRALVVEAEGLDAPEAVHTDRLHGLTADVEHGPGVREQPVGGVRVACELGDREVAERHHVAAVSGGGDVVDVITRQARGVERLHEGTLRGSPEVVPGGEGRAPEDRAGLVGHDRLGVGGSDVDAGRNAHGVIPPSASAAAPTSARSSAYSEAPMAPQKCDSSLTLMGEPVSSSIRLTIATLRATPPVNVISGSIPTRRRSDRLREAIAMWTPLSTSSVLRPRASHPRISDSAKTVQVVVIVTGSTAVSARGPSSPRGISSACEAAPRKRPVPAEHLSFMQKSSTCPTSPTRIAFVSCPPMSSTLLVWGNR